MIAHYDVGYIIIMNSVLTVLGLAQTRKISRTLVPE